MVTRGACSPQDGCGIGLSEKEPIPIQNNSVTIPDEDYVSIDKQIEELKKEVLKKEVLKQKIKKAKGGN